jgi:hypothetical protein
MPGISRQLDGGDHDQEQVPNEIACKSFLFLFLVLCFLSVMEPN